MPRIMTAGMASCATISIGLFKNDKPGENEAYLKDKSKFEDRIVTCKKDVDSFFNKVLYPVEQNLGLTKSYPFDMLMDCIEESPLKTKMMLVTIPSHQMNGEIPNRLKARGFKMVLATRNSIGGAYNYLWINNPNQVEIRDEYKEKWS